MLRLVEKFRAARENEDGMTIIEVMVAMTVFALIAAGVAAGVASTMLLTRDSRAREVAVGIASEAIDAARTASSPFNVDSATSTVPRSGISYIVTETSRWVTSTGAGDVCGGGGGPLSYKRVSINVSWATGRSSQSTSINMNSLIAPTTAVTSANLGTIIVGVSKQDGSGNAGVSVTIKPNSANPNGATAITSTIPATDNNGCSYALNVTPGQYDVTINKSGGIDDGTTNGGTQVASPTKTVSARAGQTASASFLYDTAATFRIHYQDPYNTTAAFTTPSTLSTTFWHKSTYYTATTASSVSMFPFSDGYQVAPTSAATCAAVDPGNWTTAVGTAVAKPDAQYGPDLSLGTDVYVPVQTFSVKLGSGLDSVLKATQVNMPASSGTPSCATTTTYTFSGLNPSNTYTLALPYGTYTLTETTALLGLSTGVPAVTAASGASYVAGTRTLTLDPRRAP